MSHRPPLPLGVGGKDLASAVRDTRQVIFNGVSMETTVYWREDLPLNMIFESPAIIEALGSTTVVPPGFYISMDPTGSLILDLKTKKLKLWFLVRVVFRLQSFLH